MGERAASVVRQCVSRGAAIGAALALGGVGATQAGPRLKAGADVVEAAAAPQWKGAAGAGCRKRTGQGWAPSEHFARLKAWEVVAQATGNWPIQSDEFRSTRYQCRADRGGRLCSVAIEVCRPGGGRRG